MNAGVKAIVQPGGSIRDEEVIEAAKKAVKRGLTIDQQSKVDAMADALEAAIKGLTLKSQAPGDNKGDGTQSGTHKGDASPRPRRRAGVRDHHRARHVRWPGRRGLRPSPP